MSYRAWSAATKAPIIAPKFKIYSKAELLEVLNEKCPGILDNFPSPDAFEFRRSKCNGQKGYAVKVGFRVAKENQKGTRTVKEELWLEEFQPYDPRSYPSETLAARVQIGDTGPFNGYDPIYRPVYGADAKNERKRQEKYIGLFYTTAAGQNMNSTIYNARAIKGNAIFGKLNDSGIISPYAESLKALLRFVLVHCGHATEYQEFESGNGKINGLAPLFRAIKSVANRSSDQVEEQSEGLQAADDNKVDE